MKKLISILALAALVVIPLQGAHAVNPPKAGENCPKEGLIQTAGNKKFTCIKLGTKLYWNNGVTVKKTNKSPISDLLKIPATCTVVLPEWSSIPQSVNAGAVSYSTLILNSSVSFSAVNILVFIDWYDRYGKVNSEKISIPRLIPGQSVALGQYSSFSTNGLPKIPEPNEISIRSTCKSERYTRILPTLTGKSAVNLEELEDYGTKIFILKSKILFDNKFSKTLSCELKCNYQVYGVYKDQYDNTFGGFAGDPYGTEEIASGDSGSIEIATEFGFTDYPIPEWLDRITKIDYTIIPKF